MKIIVLVLMVWNTPGNLTKIEAPFDTVRDCEVASAIMGRMPNTYSADCETRLSERWIDWSAEQGT